MEAVGSRLSRASSRYGASTVFTGPVRKWKKKWVQVNPSSSASNTTTTNNNKGSHANSNSSSRLLLRRWTPTTADDAAAVSDEPPRRKFRYTPIAVLEEQKKIMVVKKEHESATESDQPAVRQKNITHERQGKLNMDEILEETKDSNIVKLDHGLDLESNNDETSLNSDNQLETNI
ncbi:hypothetical protein PHAVU_006G048400 [Phaseolus vulgaris]|uniref:Uncharacterized protein n=1 Tax=Phaseolus vulgaris TaxID=3885 RepID=V7BPL4_PHAVU|nr:hypothetical protein PHAVU_006G048400g [Phaseolus vulgaris]ESW18521.1 hypothetical protein PHAVU_006G048400g [Phaseolus vulgaris]